MGFFSEIKIIIWAECVSSSQVAPNVESFVVILLYFVKTQKVNCVWMTHCCCVDSELGLCQFYWVSIFVCILRFPGYFHHKVSNPIYACDTIKQSFSHLTSPKSHTNKIYQQMQNRTPSPSVNTMIIMIRFNANCKSIQTIKQTSYWPGVASSVFWLGNT